MTTNKILVTGANGHFGRRVVELLLETGEREVVAATRSPDKIADLAARGAELRAANFDMPASLADAFRGVERILIVSTDALGIPGQRQRQHRAAVDAAARAGVRHIVYTSMPNPGPGSLIPFAPDHHETELAIMNTGVPFTILRMNWYMENLFMWLPHALDSGVWHTASGAGRVGYVAREDTARAAAAALVKPPSNGHLDISGPAALSAADLVTTATAVFGRPIERIDVTDDQLRAGLLAAGVPPPLAELVVAMDANTRAGNVDLVSDGVVRLTGSPPQTLRAFLDSQRAIVPG